LFLDAKFNFMPKVKFGLKKIKIRTHGTRPKTRTGQLLGVDIHGLYGYWMSTPMVTYWCGGVKNPCICSQRGERQNCMMGLI
jgi:hypothetical protein